MGGDRVSCWIVVPAWPGFGTELFPTTLRAFGTSAKYLGQSVSFMVAGVLIAGTGNLSRAVLVLSGGPLIAAGLIVFFFPETGGRELEQISPPPGPIGRYSPAP